MSRKASKTFRRCEILAEILKVSSTSDPSATAGALANTIREEGVAELQAIGPKAVNQAIKAITIARGYMAPSGVDLIFVPSFVDVEIDGENKTAMRMKVQTRLPF
ncbi:stage V sporulation protein S, partial [Candidatus Bipolaricaulota bacterium]|nr:stage V sporulation protein S [Candidatus Bipolaricaulota bacterium]